FSLCAFCPWWHRLQPVCFLPLVAQASACVLFALGGTGFSLCACVPLCRAGASEHAAFPLLVIYLPRLSGLQREFSTVVLKTLWKYLLGTS
ncbi:MAG: hypothetical protein ACYDBL_14765, partial [Candidatus Acidiferrales bacterium]